MLLLPTSIRKSTPPNSNPNHLQKQALSLFLGYISHHFRKSSSSPHSWIQTKTIGYLLEIILLGICCMPATALSAATPQTNNSDMRVCCQRILSFEACTAHKLHQPGVQEKKRPKPTECWTRICWIFEEFAQLNKWWGDDFWDQYRERLLQFWVPRLKRWKCCGIYWSVREKAKALMPLQSQDRLLE